MGKKVAPDCPSTESSKNEATKSNRWSRRGDGGGRRTVENEIASIECCVRKTKVKIIISFKPKKAT